MTNLDEIVIVTNGPGELFTWVTPVVKRLKKAFPSTRLELYLIRDQFSSGTEVGKAEALGFDFVGTRRNFLLKRNTRGLNGIVLMLGGAPRDAVSMGKKLAYASFAYSFEAKAYKPGLKAFFVDSQSTQKKVGPVGTNVIVVGNLVRDAVEDEPVSDAGNFGLLLFPSSRPAIFKILLGYLLAIAENFAKKNPSAKIGIVLSPLIPQEILNDGLSGKTSIAFGGISGRLQANQIITRGGSTIDLIFEDARYSAMQNARAAVLIPGTTTLELAICKTPSVVIFPLHKTDIIPLEGVLHWLFLLPGAKILKRRFIENSIAKNAFLALPNRIAGEEIFPEMKGIFSPEQVAEKLEAISTPKATKNIISKLSALDIKPGADNLVDYLVKIRGSE